MRHWLLHPVIFYPLVAVVAVLLIGASLRPQAWPRTPTAAAGAMAEGALVLEGEALGAPAPEAAQEVFVPRDFWGRAQALRIAVKPEQAAPGPSDTGVRVLLAPAAAALLARPVVVEVTYSPLPVNAATALAVSAQGEGQAANWATQALPAQAGVVRFSLPAAAGATALGLRAITTNTDQTYGVEITRIRIVPTR